MPVVRAVTTTSAGQGAEHERAPVTRQNHASAACFSSAIRSSSARLFFSAADFNWPQAAMMSRPRGRRIGAEIPASKTMSEKRRIRSSSEHS